jgi:negative regulator of sigma E activity
MARVKTTTYIDERLRRAAKTAAARSGMKEYELYEEALRRYLGWEILDTLLARPSDLTEDEAMRIAVEEVHAARQARARAAGPGDSERSRQADRAWRCAALHQRAS